MKRAKECAAIMANRGQTTSVVTEPVPPTTLQKEAPKTDAQMKYNTTPVKDVEWEQEILTLSAELAAQEALRPVEGGRQPKRRRGEEENRRKFPEKSSKQRPVEGGKRKIVARKG